LADALASVEDGYGSFKAHVDYTSLFVDSMHRKDAGSFKARPQVDRILETFGSFARDRHLECSNEVADDARVIGPPIAAYSGVLLNLYTNALKAVLAREGGAEPPQVVFRGWNEPRMHVIEVMDKGIGIPAELRERIFDPLFTTTSSVSNPLGSGMGLGLSLVREVVNHSGGKLRLVDAPAGFATCFRAEFEVPK
jgi:signal transduction histidine kinase